MVQIEDIQFAHEPLLFIHQPELEKPAVSMQHDYHTLHQKEMDQTTLSTLDKEEQKYRKNFKDMSILEQVKYLTLKREHIPDVKCLIVTEEQTFEGVIKEFQNDEVTIEDRKNNVIFPIPFKQIKRIRIMSL